VGSRHPHEAATRPLSGRDSGLLRREVLEHILEIFLKILDNASVLKYRDAAC
jgi:hypothetical protein